MLTGAFEFDGRQYVLDEGRILQFDKDFVDQVNEQLEALDQTDVALPSRHPKLSEGDYLSEAARASSGTVLVMDNKPVKMQGETPVELCDLYTAAGGFIHAKRHWRSSTLSHLAAQGRVGAELMLHQPAFRRAAAERLREVDTDGRFPFDPDKYRSTLAPRSAT